MTNDEIMSLAKAYMIKRKIAFVEPGEFGEKEGVKQEVIFLDPMALEPGSVLDPPDNRVWVDTETKEVTWIHQM